MDSVTGAAHALERALVTLDPLLLRRTGIREEELADVHEAVGLIVEGLAVLSRAERRLGTVGGCRKVARSLVA